MVTTVTISQNPKKKKTLGINLKYNNTYFLWKFISPKELLIFCSLKTKRLRINICYLKIWGQKIAKSRHEKTKKNQLPPTVINHKVIEIFEDWILKWWGEHGMQKPLLCFLLPTNAPLEREREREGDSLHFASCRSDCTRDPSFSRGRTSGLVPLSSIASAIIDSAFAENSMHENRLSLRDLLSITLPFSSSSFFLHNA
jgi:hypothetical protein